MDYNLNIIYHFYRNISPCEDITHLGFGRASVAEGMEGNPPCPTGNLPQPSPSLSPQPHRGELTTQGTQKQTTFDVCVTISLLGLMQQSHSLGSLKKNTPLIVLEARSPRSRCRQGWALSGLQGRICPRPLSSAWRSLSFLCLFISSSLYACLSLCPNVPFS